MTREQWDLYFAAREVFYYRPEVRLRTIEWPDRSAYTVAAKMPGDVERMVMVSRYDLVERAPLIALWDLRDAIPAPGEFIKRDDEWIRTGL